MPRQVTPTIQCAGVSLAPSHDVQHVSLTQSMVGHHQFEITVPFDQVEGALIPFLTDAHVRLLGQSLTLQADADAFHFNRGQQLLFQGVVTHLDTGKDNDYAGSVRVSGYSPCQLLASGRKKRTFVAQTLEGIFQKVLEPFPANVLARTIAPVHREPLPYVVQYQETNFEFLSRLAAEYGEWFYYDGRTLRLGLPAQQEEEVDFWADGHYNNFRFSMSLQPVRERLYDYDYQKNEHFQSSTLSQQLPGLKSHPFLQFALSESEKLYEEAHRVSERVIRGLSQLDEEALLAKANQAAGLVTAMGTSDNPQLQLGRVLNIQGQGIGSRHLLPDSFGKYRITSITHTIDYKGNYSNYFMAVPFQTLVPPRHPATRMPTGTPELAEVIDDKDPAKLGRLKVRYYWPVKNSQDAETDWIRVLTPYSGDGKGQMFNPEIGSQVMVAYEDNMAEQPFVLGNMFHSGNPQGASYTRPGNHVKSIRDKDGNDITFNAGIKGIKSATEAIGKLITITNSNKKSTGMELGFDGKGRVTIKTLGPVHVSGSSITLDAGPLGDITLHAARIAVLGEENITMIAKETLAFQANEIEGKGEEHIHLDGGKKLITSSDDTFHC